MSDIETQEEQSRPNSEIHKMDKNPTILSSSSSTESSRYESDEPEELQRMPLAPPAWNTKRRLSKQLSMCQTPRDAAWEKFRRRQILKQERKKQGLDTSVEMILTDEDLHELKGSIELGFGFNEEDGQRLCSTLPALDLYFAVNRQLSLSPISTPPSGRSSESLGGISSSVCGSPRSDSDSWKICSPGTTFTHYLQKNKFNPTVTLVFFFQLPNRRRSAAGEDKAEALGTSCGLFHDAVQLRSMSNTWINCRGRVGKSTKQMKENIYENCSVNFFVRRRIPGCMVLLTDEAQPAVIIFLASLQRQ